VSGRHIVTPSLLLGAAHDHPVQGGASASLSRGDFELLGGDELADDALDLALAETGLAGERPDTRKSDSLVVGEVRDG